MQQISAERVVVVGAGVVGEATGRALQSIGHDVTYVDRNPHRVEQLVAEGLEATTTVALRGGELVLVSVPTPSTGDAYDLSTIEDALESIVLAAAATTTSVVVAIRSTVPPGFGQHVARPILDRSAGARIALVAAPEFLRQASALEDALHPWVLVVGSDDSTAAARVAQAFAPLGGAQTIFDSSAAAEMVKIVHNCWNATKISFWNEIGSLCTAAGVDGLDVAQVVARSAEASINPLYGIVSGRPFGGACLPKDLDGLLGFAASVDVDAPLLTAVRTVNHRVGAEDL